MPITDKALLLTSGALGTGNNITTSTQGAAVTCGRTGTLGPINNGDVAMAIMRFNSTIEHDSGDETLDMFVEGYDGTTYYTLGAFPRISFDATTPALYNWSNMQSRLGIVAVPIVIPLWVTQLRWRSVVAGTVVTGWLGTEVLLYPTNFKPSTF